ncbi:MAG: biotin synthase BioB, partial [Rhodococcus qingshengii]
MSTAPATVDILDQAREQVLERGVGLTESQVLDVLRLDDDRLEDLLALAHDVRMKWCG